MVDRLCSGANAGARQTTETVNAVAASGDVLIEQVSTLRPKPSVTLKVTESFLLSVHVVAGILFVGPVAVMTSLFPRYAPVIRAGPDSAHDVRSLETARLIHRVTRVYGMLAIAVPVVGLTLAGVQGRTTEIWVVVAMVLTAIAGGLLALQIAPRQREALTAPDDGTQLRRLSMIVGVFNLLWATVVVLMVVRPGSSYS